MPHSTLSRGRLPSPRQPSKCKPAGASSAAKQDCHRSRPLRPRHRAAHLPGAACGAAPLPRSPARHAAALRPVHTRHPPGPQDAAGHFPTAVRSAGALLPPLCSPVRAHLRACASAERNNAKAGGCQGGFTADRPPTPFRLWSVDAASGVGGACIHRVVQACAHLSHPCRGRHLCC